MPAHAILLQPQVWRSRSLSLAHNSPFIIQGPSRGDRTEAALLPSTLYPRLALGIQPGLPDILLLPPLGGGLLLPTLIVAGHP